MYVAISFLIRLRLVLVLLLQVYVLLSLLMAGFILSAVYIEAHFSVCPSAVYMSTAGKQESSTEDPCFVWIAVF